MHLHLDRSLIPENITFNNNETIVSFCLVFLIMLNNIHLQINYQEASCINCRIRQLIHSGSYQLASNSLTAALTLLNRCFTFPHPFFFKFLLVPFCDENRHNVFTRLMPIVSILLFLTTQLPLFLYFCISAKSK